VRAGVGRGVVFSVRLPAAADPPGAADDPPGGSEP
jgi:hypothetical protein